jgi:hypothetical protein
MGEKQKMDILNLIREMALAGYPNFLGTYNPKGSYTMRFVKPDGEPDKNVIDITKKCKDNFISFEIDIIDNEGKKFESGLLTIENFFNLYAKLIGKIIDKDINVPELKVKPSKN